MKKFPHLLWILAFVLIVITACESSPVSPLVMPTNELIEPTSSPLVLTRQDLENLEYRGIYDQAVKLSAGQYSGPPFVEGGASRPTLVLQTQASGDLDQDGVADAAVLLVENSGGSGSFTYLAAVLNANGIPVNTSTILLGDRVKVQSIQVADNQIHLSILTHAPKDALCCPTQEAEMKFLLKAGQLVPLENE
jgi:hypothetical protein